MVLVQFESFITAATWMSCSVAHRQQPEFITYHYALGGCRSLHAEEAEVRHKDSRYIYYERAFYQQYDGVWTHL